MTENGKGPRLTDQLFFSEAVDTRLTGLQGIPAALERQDFKACRSIFAAFIREQLMQREGMFFGIPYEFPENNFILPEESVEEAIERIRKRQLAAVSIPYQFEGKVDWFSNHAPNNYKEWNFQLNRHPEFKLLAHHYRETGEEADAEAFAALFDSWVKQVTVPEKDDTEPIPTGWRTIECGIRMGANWPYSLFAFYKSAVFTDNLLVDWYKSVWEHGEYLYRKHRKRGNWLIMEMNGLGQIGILYPEFRKSHQWLSYAMDMLAQELDRQVYPDGFQYELSTGYHYVVINNYMRFIKTAKAFGVQVQDQLSDKLAHMLEVYRKVMEPDGFTPDINDGGRRSVKKLLGEVLPYLKERNVLKIPDYQSIAMEYSGIMVFRDGWTKESTWALLDAGPFGTGHQHEDKLNLLIHAGGKEIVTECGNYAYDGSQMRQYALSTRSHNTVRVDGMDQNRRATYQWQDEDIIRKSEMEYGITTNMDWAAGIYTDGYGDAVDKSVSHQRTVLFIKKSTLDLAPFILVVDRMYAKEKHDYEILWHLNAEEVVVLDCKVTADFMQIFSSLHKNDEDAVKIVKGQTEPEWQGFAKGKTFVQGDIVPQPVLQYAVSGSDKRMVTLFYPKADCPVVGIEAGEAVEGRTITLVMQNGRKLDVTEPVTKYLHDML